MSCQNVLEKCRDISATQTRRDIFWQKNVISTYRRFQLRTTLTIFNELFRTKFFNWPILWAIFFLLWLTGHVARIQLLYTFPTPRGLVLWPQVGRDRGPAAAVLLCAVRVQLNWVSCADTNIKLPWDREGDNGFEYTDEKLSTRRIQWCVAHFYIFCF